jgi:uncharacterized membrane protein
LKVLPALLGLLYPFLVFLGLAWLSARAVALVVGAALLLRYLVRLRDRPRWGQSPGLGVAAVILALVTLAALLDDGRYVMMVPVIVNAGLCLVFARSLVRGPSMAEVLARLRHAHLPVEHRPYCHRVTAVWAVYFAGNTLLIVWLAATASLEAWTVYTGLIAYLLAATLFGGERTYRAWRFRHYGAGPVDAILRRIFPPPLDAPP